MKSLTVAIPSYQRRDSVVRLVTNLNDQAVASPEAWADVDVVVVLDGSTDGSEQALARLDLLLPLTVRWQPNGGPARTRNACLDGAKGDLVWFLDDDLIPLPGSIEARRAAHEGADVAVLGPCAYPPDLDVPADLRRWWDDLNESRVQAGRIHRLDQLPIGIANLSGPTQVFRAIGGFDESFRGYGMEDSDFAVRVMNAELEIRFLPEAACWHYSSEIDDSVNRERRRQEGRNVVRLVRKHPQIADLYFPRSYPSQGMRLLDRSHLRSPRGLMAVSTLAALLSRPAVRLLGKRWSAVRTLAFDAAYAAGVADVDPSLLTRVFGRPR